MSKLAEVLARLDEIKARAEHVREEADYYPANCRKEEAALADDADALIAALEEARDLLRDASLDRGVCLVCTRSVAYSYSDEARALPCGCLPPRRPA